MPLFSLSACLLRGHLSIYSPTHTQTPGGQYDSYHNDKDVVWQNRFAEFLVDKCLSDQFVWDLNPESSDTGGTPSFLHPPSFLSICCSCQSTTHLLSRSHSITHPPTHPPTPSFSLHKRTTGILKGDWWTPEEAKLKLYDTVQPHPSWLSVNEAGEFVLEPGQYANAKCNPHKH